MAIGEKFAKIISVNVALFQWTQWLWSDIFLIMSVNSNIHMTKKVCKTTILETTLIIFVWTQAWEYNLSNFRPFNLMSHIDSVA